MAHLQPLGLTTAVDAEVKLSERLDARAAFEDKRVLDEARAMGFVPEVYTGSQTGALLREAAEFARRVEAGHDVVVTHWEQAGFAKAGLPIPDEGSIVRIVPEAGQGVPDGGR